MAQTNIAVVGGGAAGFFTAINLALKNTKTTITLYEGSSKFLSKVLISGGGRCNVTNAISKPEELIKQYPRGEEFLLPVFKQFASTETQDWFQKHGVALKTEEDGRVFPQSDSSQTIYNCLVRLAKENGVTVKLEHRLTELIREENQWKLSFKELEVLADYVVLCTSCSNQVRKMITSLGISYVAPLPSLFTFNAQNHVLKELSGVSVPHAKTSIKEIKGSSDFGPLLVTHWGFSGPAILRLSAWQARQLAELNYEFTLQIQWDKTWDKQEYQQLFQKNTLEHPKEKIVHWKGHDLPKRLWSEIVQNAQIEEYKNWSELGKKGIVRLIDSMFSFEVAINGKSTFKAEFVTAGGIHLSEIDPHTFEVRQHENLYAAGELLNIDAITGGFNFQAAWSGAYVISNAISTKLLSA